MKNSKFIGTKVKVYCGEESPWNFDTEKEYAIAYDDFNWFHVVDEHGVPLCLSENQNSVYAPGVEWCVKVEIVK